MARILVTGGAGYIGSHTVRQLSAAHHDVVVVDDLSAGHRGAVGPGAELVVQSLEDREALTDLVRERRPEAAIHFAGAIEPAESMRDPGKYYRLNLGCGLNLLDALCAAGAPPIVFSSTCAVYGQPTKLPVHEDDPKAPVSPYGESKLAFEHALAAYDRAHGLRSTALRYFNAAGAAADATIGDDHLNKIHLITVGLLTALGQRDAVPVFGTDYPTPDGTCIRDYIHVDDLASAHVLAVERLVDGAPSTRYNLGLGLGFSVAEVLDAVERVTGSAVRRDVSPRREGDPAALYADPTAARDALGWTPEYTDLDRIVQTAWRWHQANPGGFGD